MTSEELEPRLELLCEEYVLVQAWKKTSTYIRNHNWFSDTLALDCAAVNLPAFIGQLRDRLQSTESWQNDPLRVVFAPKSQNWEVSDGGWRPEEEQTTAEALRPLAHVSLADQVVAAALMLCLADRVETLQGDPRQPTSDQSSRRKVISYGNRLFCDAIDGKLRHRWGSGKLYRAYYQDYRTFLSRPEVAAGSIPDAHGSERIFVVHADLRKFYDCVSPGLLTDAIGRVRRDSDNPAFFSLANSVLNWGWDRRDEQAVRMYADESELSGFTRVALPQGLVASGFFANVVLLPFDEALKAAIGTEISPGILVTDTCRYVDDLRIVIAVDLNGNSPASDLEAIMLEWLSGLLSERARGLELSSEKTVVHELGSEERPLVRQRAKMNQIQSAVSGGFDAVGGEEILKSIQGLMHAQQTLGLVDDAGWRHSPVPDVADETVARFGAARFRSAFRSTRPLLDGETPQMAQSETRGFQTGIAQRASRTRRDLDEEARVFSQSLIKSWVKNPSNMRLLRIGLDIWPDVDVLREVLKLLHPFTEKGGQRKAPRRVAWYCLAEILRAGATETGIVADNELLPSGIDLKAYRKTLGDEAIRLLKLPRPRIPWYLRQQALLFFAAFDPKGAPFIRPGTSPETRRYRELILYLRGDGDRFRHVEFASSAVLARRAFVYKDRAIELARPGLNPTRIRRLARMDPSFLLELIDKDANAVISDDIPESVKADLCLPSNIPKGCDDTLAKAVLDTHPDGRLRNELSLLRFANAFLGQWEKCERENQSPMLITPGHVTLKFCDDQTVADGVKLKILKSRDDATGSIYACPEWCKADERWRFQLGFLLRFILSGHPDYTRPVRSADWREPRSVYRRPESHWFQRLHGLYSGQPAFGDDWLPITDWLEGFLLALLRWPGCRLPEGFQWVKQGLSESKSRINERIDELEQCRGNATGALILPLRARRPTATDANRPLHACVVQTAIPNGTEFENGDDLQLNDPAIRSRHRSHLSAALAAVKRLLVLRETHMCSERCLDWLILPELAVHPNDVFTHLVPFARAHKTLILTGLTYDEVIAGKPLVNSAYWIIPEWTKDNGLQIRTRRQGKKHLAPDETEINHKNGLPLQGFRPCQWLIGYQWSEEGARPAWLTASVCYDATDLGLASDLRNKSDVLAIPALNKDEKRSTRWPWLYTTTCSNL